MKKRPIIFSASMVRAVLAGTKTQTRRLIKPQPLVAFSPDREGYSLQEFSENEATLCDHKHLFCPYGVPGDKLWVRESFANVAIKGYDPVWFYRADDAELPLYDRRAADNRWRPSIHMPRVASRITLLVVRVRVERVRSISAADAKAEGIREIVTTAARWWGDDEKKFPTRYVATNAVAGYANLWDEIHGGMSWATNPWVWVVEFERTS